jgi:hypothetical protein
MLATLKEIQLAFITISIIIHGENFSHPQNKRHASLDTGVELKRSAARLYIGLYKELV